ncbi:hypothetical protein LTR36_003249 [Oleoguttula mirabilis]|uniref:C2H2-type domain-containing protein n=1 Tax=Oleoguttula mirabilis TaxID=1507867 RepID=A0AAV9JX08_9PEZI|nr:hypothetical protein LTR36_003249 [Oleoguttula mirabilis]
MVKTASLATLADSTKAPAHLEDLGGPLLSTAQAVPTASSNLPARHKHGDILAEAQGMLERGHANSLELRHQATQKVDELSESLRSMGDDLNTLKSIGSERAEMHKTAAEEASATIADLNSELAAVTQKLCEERVSAVEKCNAITANHEAELAATAVKLREESRSAAEATGASHARLKDAMDAVGKKLCEERMRADEMADARTTYYKALLAVESQKLREEHIAAAALAKATIAKLTQELVRISMDSEESIEEQPVGDSHADGSFLEPGHEPSGTNGEQAFTFNDDGSVICKECQKPAALYSLMLCNHFTCAVCSLRRRTLHEDITCATCEDKALTVIFTDTLTRAYADYNESDLHLVRNTPGVRCETEELANATTTLLRHKCPYPRCQATYNCWTNLHHHVKHRHGTAMCTLCTGHEKIFAHEHEVYTGRKLRKHERRTHPMCKCCHKRFASEAELRAHKVATWIGVPPSG